MKILDNMTEPWCEKVNFVDDRNVLVGYDMSQSCCENAGWFICSEIPKATDGEHPTPDVESYRFDGTRRLDGPTGESYDGGGAVAFRLVAKGKPDLFLVLYNHHNGYYSHGFTVEVGGKSIYEGSL